MSSRVLKLIQSASDEKLVDAIFDRLFKRANRMGPAALSQSQAVVFQSWHATETLATGSVADWSEHECTDPEAAIHGFEQWGLEIHAQALAGLQRLLEEHGGDAEKAAEENQDTFAELKDHFANTESEVRAKAAEWIRKRPSSFLDV